MKKKFKLKTSANVDAEFYKELVKASKRFNKTEEQMLKELICLAIQAFRCGHVKGILTEYQDHSPESWEKLYYSLDEEEIEIFGIARQKYKISVSKLAFIGFVLFWRLLLLKYEEKLDSIAVRYDFNSYDKYCSILKKFKEYFLIRLNILQKE